MAHPFAGKAMSSRDRAKTISKGYKLGGSVGKSATADVKKYAAGGKATSDTKVPGKKSGGRLDAFARGGRAKGKGHNTKININIAPKGDHPPLGGAPPMLGGPPPMLGGPPPGLPPGGPPPGLGGPPPGGPPPGLGGPKPPGMMARGGRLKMKGGAETGQGRLDKAKGYKARG